MSIFTEEQKIKPLPRTEGSLAGEKYLTELMGQSPNVPTQDVAGLTPVQLLIQQMLQKSLTGTGQAGDLASEEYRKTLAGDYDPRTSPYYEGWRQEAERLKTAGTTQLRQRAELGGNLNASLAGAQEGELIKGYDIATLQELGKLYGTERGRKMLAAEGIQGAESRELANLAAIGGIAEQAKSVEQMEADALYNQALMTIMFPYQYQANLANSLMNYEAPYAITGGGMTDLGFGLNVGAQFAGAAIGGGIGSMAGGVGAATNAGVAPASAVYPTFGEFKSAGPYG